MVACHIDNSYDVRYTDRKAPATAKRIPRRGIRSLTAGRNGRNMPGSRQQHSSPAAAATENSIMSYTNGLLRRLRSELLRFTGGGAALASIWQVFAEFDDDGSGQIDRFELANHLRKMELGLDDDDINVVVSGRLGGWAAGRL